MCLTTAPHTWPWFEWCWCLTQNATGEHSTWVDAVVIQVATISSKKTKNSKSNSAYFVRICWERLEQKLTIWVGMHLHNDKILPAPHPREFAAPTQSKSGHPTGSSQLYGSAKIAEWLTNHNCSWLLRILCTIAQVLEWQTVGPLKWLGWWLEGGCPRSVKPKEAVAPNLWTSLEAWNQPLLCKF